MFPFNCQVNFEQTFEMSRKINADEMCISINLLLQRVVLSGGPIERVYAGIFTVNLIPFKTFF